MSYIVSWSGGKDCCYALYQAMKQGYEVSHLLNFISKDTHKVIHHGTSSDLIIAQSQAVGIPLLQQETAWGPDEYEKQFIAVLTEQLVNGLEGVIFSTIKWPEHREWEKSICRRMGIEAIQPLWGLETKDVVNGFIDSGFKAVVVSAKSELIEAKWIGRIVNQEFLHYLESKNLDVCGENSEYHSLSIDGPLFKNRLHLSDNQIIQDNDSWTLSIGRYEVCEKSVKYGGGLK